MGVQTLLGIAVEPRDAATQRDISQQLVEFINAHEWLSISPEVVAVQDELEQDDGTIMIASLLGVQMALPGFGPSMPIDRAAENAALQDVESMIEYLAHLSKSYRVQWEVELDEKGIGSIIGGQPARSITLGLIGEWRRHLARLGDLGNSA